MTLQEKITELTKEENITNQIYLDFLDTLDLEKLPFKSKIDIIKFLGYNINTLKILCKSCQYDLEVIALLHLHDEINFSHAYDSKTRNKSLEFFSVMQSPEEYFKDYTHIDLNLRLYVCLRAGFNPKILKRHENLEVEKMIQKCLTSPQETLASWEPQKFPENTFDWKKEYSKFYREKYLSPITKILENYGVISLIDFDSFVRNVCVMEEDTIPIDIKIEIEIFQRIFTHKSGLL